MKKISCVIMDWAGTSIDFGCFAPLQAFIKVFSEECNLSITMRQAREPMGLLKIDHIKAILSMPEVNAQFKALNKRDWTEDDVKEMNKSFEKHLFATLKDYTTPIDGAIQTIKTLQDQGIKIGSTTGYTQAMMEIVIPEAAKKGYHLNQCVTPTHLPAGRPAPFLIYQNMIDLNIQDTDLVVKVGDTLADIREGVNAKVWSVGVIKGSSELGLSQEEYETINAEELTILKEEVQKRMLSAGAHYVIDHIGELPKCIEQINKRLNS